QDPGPDRMVKKGRTVWAVLSLGPEVRSVPAVEGLPLREAKLGVTQEGFTLGEVTSEFSSLVPANYVIRQAPAGGTKTEAGRAVNLVVSKGEEPATTVLLPDFKGQSLEDVKARLEEMGLRLGNVWQEFSATLPPGTVVDQNPPPTTEVERGWLIDVVVSRGQASPDTGGGQSGDEDPAKPVLDSDEEGRPGTLGAGSGSSRLRTPPPSSRWHEAEVTVNVPPGQDQEVVIVVLDDFGSREVFREMKPGGSVLVQSVEGRGLDPKIRVFLGGSLIKEVSFPR
ncbi:MAG: PASTA domain-containing protein, partial [Firmicutes bacterium]|nr:PASTA domain-containing protein [Bacillota bacterium]